MSVVDDLYFIDLVNTAVNSKKTYESKLKLVCYYLREDSPREYTWYFNGNGFLQVDVPCEFLDEYLEYVESFLDCKYTTERNLGGVTVLVSLSTLYDSLNKKSNGIMKF